MLFFDSEAHAQAFYMYMNDVLDDFDDIDTVLSDFESRLGFISLRNNNMLTFREEEEGFTEEEIIALMEVDFIGDDLIKALLNPDYEVGIGNDVFVFFSKNQIYKILDGDQEARDAFIASPKGVDSVPLHLLRTGIVQLEPNPIFLIPGVVLGPQDTIQWRNCPVDVPIVVSRGCDSRRIHVQGQRFCRPPGGGVPFRCNALEYMVDFGDGSPVIVLTDVHDFRLTHTYSQDGAFTITIVTVVEDGDCDVDNDPDEYTYTEVVNTVLATCYTGDASQSRFERGSGNICDLYGIGTKVWYNKALFGPFAGAWTTAWRWDSSSAKWKPLRRGSLDFTINVSVDATFRGGGCEIIDRKQKSDSCFCHKTRVSVSKANSAFTDREIISTHSMIRGVCEIPQTGMELVNCP